MGADTSPTQIGQHTAHARVLARDLLDLAQQPDDSPIRAAFTDELDASTNGNPQRAAQLLAATAIRGHGIRIGPIVVTLDRQRIIRSTALLDPPKRLVVAIRQREIAHRSDPSLGSSVERLGIRTLARVLNVFLRLKRLRRRLRQRWAQR
jgi:hypothetical protein